MKLAKPVALFGALVASLALFGAAGTSPSSTQPDAAAKGPAWSGPVITVTGSGEVERKPDYAVVHVGVQVREKSAGSAAEKAGTAMKAISDALNELRIPNMQLQTSGVSLSPAYSWHNDGQEQRQTLLGYDA